MNTKPRNFECCDRKEMMKKIKSNITNIAFLSVPPDNLRSKEETNPEVPPNGLT